MAKCNKCGKSGLFLKLNNEGVCDACQQKQLSQLKSMVPPEGQVVLDLKSQIEALTSTEAVLSEKCNSLTSQINELENTIVQKREQIIELDDKITLQEFGLYQPTYDFISSDEYKAKLLDIRAQQKELIKKNAAVSGNSGFVYNGSVAQGNKIVADMQKLLLRAFNSECDDIISHVKFNNYDASKKRIDKSCDSISKLGKMMNIVVTRPYYELKINELSLALEYQMKKQQEKEELKEERARLKEEAKLLKEIEEARRKVEKEQAHYQNALARIESQLLADADNPDLLAKKQEIIDGLNDAEKALKDIDYREANKRAGYVYIISNIGAFGENVYKIGMTRRLEPQERVDELGDASVPFNFDVHAMIFTDDAPGLESALHKAFENRKLNMVNTRREFFNVTLDEIKSEIKKNFDKTVEFKDVPDAEQYRVSQKMKNVC